MDIAPSPPGFSLGDTRRPVGNVEKSAGAPVTRAQEPARAESIAVYALGQGLLRENRRLRGYRLVFSNDSPNASPGDGGVFP